MSTKSKRFRLMSRDQAMVHLRDRSVEPMDPSDPMHASVIAEIRRSTAAIEAGECDGAITSEELAARRAREMEPKA